MLPALFRRVTVEVDAVGLPVDHRAGPACRYQRPVGGYPADPAAGSRVGHPALGGRGRFAAGGDRFPSIGSRFAHIIDELIALPFTLFEDFAVGAVEDAVAVEHVIAEIAFITGTVGKALDAFAGALAVDEVAFIGYAFGHAQGAFAVGLTVDPVAVIDVAVRKFHDPFPLEDPLDHVAFIDAAVDHFIQHFAVGHPMDKVAFVAAAVGQAHAAFAVQTAVDPFPLDDRAVAALKTPWPRRLFVITVIRLAVRPPQRIAVQLAGLHLGVGLDFYLLAVFSRIHKIQDPFAFSLAVDRRPDQPAETRCTYYRPKT